MVLKRPPQKSELYAEPYNTCQKFKKRKTIFGHLTLKNITELKLWDTVHIDLIDPYSKYIRQQQPGDATLKILLVSPA